MPELFRKTALDRLASPERLDRAVVITPPLFAAVLSGGLLIIAAAVLWGFFGKVPVSIKTEGIYVVNGEDAIGEIVCYLPLKGGKQIQPGMEAVLRTPTGSLETAYVAATVTSVEEYVTSKEDIKKRLKEDTLVEYFLAQGPVVEVICSVKDGAFQKDGSGFLMPGTPVDVDIITEKKTPAALLISGNEGNN